MTRYLQMTPQSRNKKGELQAAAEVFRGQRAAFQSQLDFLVKHVAETREQNTVDTKKEG